MMMYVRVSGTHNDIKREFPKRTLPLFMRSQRPSRALDSQVYAHVSSRAR